MGSTISKVTELFSNADDAPLDAPQKVISRPPEELIIGLVGAVGAGVSKTALVLKKILTDDYGYEADIIKASDLVQENASKTSTPSPSKQGAERIKDLQKVGTELRERFGEDYIAAKAIERIAIKRKLSGGYDENTEVPQPKPQRLVTIIDSLKHPKESALFRNVYGGIYWQFTIFAPETVRDERLQSIGISKENLSRIFTRDENDKEGDHGQKVSKTAHLSDFFIRNDRESNARLIAVINRYLEIIFNIGVHTPTLEEAGMHSAVSASSKSACLSRQVGAAIYSDTGELVSVGWNDVPKSKGGLYAAECGDEDNRCFRWGGKMCHNHRKKEDLYDKLFEQLNVSGLLAGNATKETFRSSMLQTSVKDLIEYSRSIHAEMEAIVSAGRTGKSGMVAGTLYTTTFPCHNCARHIVAAGIARVIYVEPYAKSLALELHRDSISMSEGSQKVAFLQYEGVGPNSVLKLFHHGTERKNSNGKAHEVDKKTAIPILPPANGRIHNAREKSYHAF